MKVSVGMIDMRKRTYFKCGIFLMLCFLQTWMIMGCNKENIEVRILDCQTETLLKARIGQTVEQLLAEAEITVEEKDIVEPSLETVVNNNTEISILRYTKTSVTAENKAIEVELLGGKVEDALEEAGVELRKNDYVNHALDAYLTDGMAITIEHRLEITLTVDGKTEKCLTQMHTVKEFLEEQEVALGKLDRVSPKLSGELKDGIKVVVKRVEVKERTEVEPIAFETEVTYSNSMLAGTSKITRNGVDGEKRVTYKVTYVDGKEESREVIQEEILKKAVNQVVCKGSKPKGKTVVSKERVDDCDGSGHGYYVITYSDGTVEYQDY